MEIIKLFFIGIILGVANVIPGVSGGTIAVVFNIYDRLVSIITIKIKAILKEWKFILPLGLGMVAGIIGFSKILTILFEHYPMQTNLFFVGIIAGSIPLIYRKIHHSMDEVKAKGKKSPVVSTIISLVVAVGIMAVMAIFKDMTGTDVVYTELSVPLFFVLMASGAVAAIAMIIPGISGSFLLLVMGMYTTVIAAVSDMNFPLLIPTAIGVIIGLLVGAFLVRLLMDKLPAQTYGAIFGLVFGSMFTVFPLAAIITCFQNYSLGWTSVNGVGGAASTIALVTGLLSCGLGFFTSWFSSRKA